MQLVKYGFGFSDKICAEAPFLILHMFLASSWHWPWAFDKAFIEIVNCFWREWLFNITCMPSRFFMRSEVFCCIYPNSIRCVTNDSSLLRHNVWRSFTAAVIHVWRNAISIYLRYNATKESLVPIWVATWSSFPKKVFRKVYVFRLFLL